MGAYLKLARQDGIMSTSVCVSGYFDPLHVGHIDYMRRARLLGDKLTVIVNNDTQAALKKGRAFMPAEERVQIIQSLKMVDHVYISADEDRSVCHTLEMIHPDIFCNGGDQTSESIPEAEICRRLGIKLVFGLGEKIQSSSWLIGASQDGLST